MDGGEVVAPGRELKHLPKVDNQGALDWRGVYPLPSTILDLESTDVVLPSRGACLATSKIGSMGSVAVPLLPSFRALDLLVVGKSSNLPEAGCLDSRSPCGGRPRKSCQRPHCLGPQVGTWRQNQHKLVCSCANCVLHRLLIDSWNLATRGLATYLAIFICMFGLSPMVWARESAGTPRPCNERCE